MTAANIAFVISSGWLGAKLLCSVAEIFSKAWYEFRNTREEKSLHKIASSKALKKRPLISVVIYTHNAENTITGCLESIAKSRYRKLEVIIVDNGSTDKTLSTVRNYIKDHPKKNVRMVVRRTHRPDSKIKLRRHMINGELIMRINDRHRVSNSIFKDIVRYFALLDVHELIPSTRITPHKSLTGLLQQYDVLQPEPLLTYGLDADRTYYSIKLRGSTSSKRNVRYVDDALLLSEPVASFRKLFKLNVGYHLNALRQFGKQSKDLGFWSFLKLARVAVLLIEPFAIAYFVYLALQFQRPEPLVLAWVTSIFILVFYVWSDKHTPAWQKLRLIILAPNIYLPFYLLSFSWLFAILGIALSKIQADWQSWPHVGVQA